VNRYSRSVKGNKAARFKHVHETWLHDVGFNVCVHGSDARPCRPTQDCWPRIDSSILPSMPLKSFQVSIGLPFGLGSFGGTWEPDEKERMAAWEMYVELITRVSIQGLKQEEGLLREALSSLYSLFETTRQILREYGPGIAIPSGNSELSFGMIAVTILNRALRPFLAQWHPALAQYESVRPDGVSQVDHERAWDRVPQLRTELDELRLTLTAYAEQLGAVAGVPPLIIGARE